MTRTIRMVEHQDNWTTRFQQEKKRLEQLWGDAIVDIHHVGSTAIETICAKPIIDLLVEVRNVNELDALDERMLENGYLPKGENGIADRRFYIRGTEDERLAHIHAFNSDHSEVARHVRFVQYLRAHPQDASAYAKLKIQLAEQFPHDGGAYSEGKSAFISEIDARARAWAKHTN